MPVVSGVLLGYFGVMVKGGQSWTNLDKRG